MLVTILSRSPVGTDSDTREVTKHTPSVVKMGCQPASGLLI